MRDLDGRQVWVVGAGDQGRRNAFARHFRLKGISAIGPSEPHTEIKRIRQATAVRKFSGEGDSGDHAKPGDAVILRGGTKEILGVGVLGSYKHLPCLGVTGWDLGHVRSTHWLDLEPKEINHLNALRKRSGRLFGWVSFHPLNAEHDAIRKYVETLIDSNDIPEKALRPYEGAAKLLGRGELAEEVCGKVASDINIGELEAILDEADGFGIQTGDYPRLEADTVAMILVPLLKVLGANYSNIRVEVPLRFLAPSAKAAKRVDLVVLDPESQQPKVIVEAKRRWSGLDWATTQLKQYTDEIGRGFGGSVTSVVTDGSEFIIQTSGPDPDREFSLRWRDPDTVAGLASLAAVLSG